jgi:extracellular elastinolytic metalloproteinase
MTRLPSLLAAVLLVCSAHAFLTAQDAIPTSSTQSGQRKSLGFGPHHAHRKLISKEHTPRPSTFASPSTEEVFSSALRLAKEVTGGESSFFVRSDSYTDPSSGLTFVFVKQTVNGLQVEDGDMNAVYASDGECLY